MEGRFGAGHAGLCVLERGGGSQEELRKAASSPEGRMPVGVLKAVT